MKTSSKYTNTTIELSIWQLFAIIIAAIATLVAIVPLVSQYRSTKCNTIYIEDAFEPPNYHKRYVRDIKPRDQCSVDIPPMCSATTTITTDSTSASSTTTRTTVSTVSVTRPVITNFPTTVQTTTPNPWVNQSRPYNSWRLPTFATPIDYTLHIACPDCFTLISNLTTITFNGQVSIRINILNPTQYLILHAKNLNIIQARLISGGTGTATVTYLPEYDMIYLYFGPSNISVGEIILLIDYTGIINEQDQTGFYRELFWKSIGEISYLLAANFQPIYARQAFPCFDEPNIQARFTLTLEHPQNSTIALSNTIVAFQNASLTTFETTQNFSTYSLAWAILPLDEFKLTTQSFQNTTINIWIRPELVGESNVDLTETFDIIRSSLEFIQDYLNISNENLPIKLDFIGIPDLILDEKGSIAWGLLTFREEFLSIDLSLNSAERLQTRTKILVEHILQIWFSKTDWWDNLWFQKSLSNFLAYKMIDIYYSSYKLMEQFAVREMLPLMIDDFKPNILPISNKNLTNNEEILESLSINMYSKGASLFRLLEYIVSNDTFQIAVRNILSLDDLSNLINTFYSNFGPLLNTSVTIEDVFRSWTEQKNYPLVTVDFVSGNDTTIIFHQKRYLGLFESNGTSFDQNYTWKIYMECDLGGLYDVDGYNLTGNYVSSRLKFILESPTYTINLPNETYLWIKCNKDFYSYQITEYISQGGDIYGLWRSFDLLFREDIFSNNDKANLLNDAFLLPYGGQIVTYDQTVELLRTMFRNPVDNYLSWSVFVWYWNYLTGVEEHSKYFWNFKRFATQQILAPFGSNINNIVTNSTDHQERLLKSMFFELLCHVQNPDALNKATELFRLIPSNYFSNSSHITNVGADYLSTVIYYHLQNVNDINEWDYLWINFTENQRITSQQRSSFLRALGATKEIWRLKTILEYAFDRNSRLIETQEFFDLIISISQNPNGRDVVWNFYRQNYQSLLERFGYRNRLFNQLITSIVQSFENKYYYSQMINFLNQYPSSLQNQQLALDQIQLNIAWFNNNLAEAFDDAISSGDRARSNN